MDSTLRTGVADPRLIGVLPLDLLSTCTNDTEFIDTIPYRSLRGPPSARQESPEVLFEPGQMATMGGGSSDPEPKMSENCKASNSTCLPDLPVKYQECISNKAKAPRAPLAGRSGALGRLSRLSRV